MNLLLAVLAAVTLLVRTGGGEFVVDVDVDRAPNTDAQKLTPPIRTISSARVPAIPNPQFAIPNPQ